MKGRSDCGDLGLRASAFLVVVALSVTLLSVTITMPGTVAAYTPYPSKSVPSAPTELTATPGDAQVVLTWEAPSSIGGSPITNYKVYRGTTSGGETLLVTLGKVRTYTDTGLTNGQTYYYKVSAVNAIGEGPQSNEASATPATVPSSPLNLTSIPGNGNVTLTWDPPASDGGSPILNYTVRRREGAGTYQPIARLGDVTSFVDTGLANGVTYYYEVSAVNLVGEGPLSSEISATPIGTPSAPLDLQATPGITEVTLTWSSPADDGGSLIVNYRIYRGTSSGGESYLTAVGNQLTYTDVGLINGQTYFYKVSAVNLAVEGPLSSEASATIISLPYAPQNLLATSGVSEVTLTWSAPSSDGGSFIINYRIYRGTTLGGESLLTTIGNQLSYTDTSVTAGTTYYYKVSAVNAVGEGPLSNEASATVPTEPSAPQSFQAWAGDGQVILTWSAPASDGGSSITNYKIYRGTSSGGESHLTTVGNQSSYIDSGLTNGVTYYYKVSAVNSVGQGLLSEEASATPTPGNSVPSSPENLAATSGNGQVILTWSAPAGDGGSSITNYKIYRGTVSGGESDLTKVGNVLSYTDTGLTNGQTYFYMVSAVNAVGEGPRSNEVSATPESGNTVPSPPRNLQALAGNGQVTLTWSAPASNGGSAISGYKIYRGTVSSGESYLTTVGNQLSYIDPGLVNGVTYFHKVSAVNSVGEGPLSNEASATPSQENMVPSPVKNLQVSAGDAEVVITWSAPSDDGGSPITGYNIYRGTTPGAIAYLTTITTSSYSDTNVTNGQTYYYKVCAVNAVGEGLLSGGVVAVPGSARNGGIDTPAQVGMAIVSMSVMAAVVFFLMRPRK